MGASLCEYDTKKRGKGQVKTTNSAFCTIRADGSPARLIGKIGNFKAMMRISRALNEKNTPAWNITHAGVRL